MEVRDAAGKVMMSKDSSSIAALKAIILPIVDEQFKIQEIHILATLLDPIMKNKLPGMGIDAPQFKNATESLREKMMSLKIDDDTKSNGNLFGEQEGTGIGCTITRTAPPTAKCQRISSETISMYDACSSDEDEVHDDTAKTTGGGGQLANLSVLVNLEHAAFLDYEFPKLK